MKFKMPENSLFARLLRSPWWVSLGIGVTLGLVCAALFPAHLRVVGALSGAPFLVIAAMAAWRQRGQVGPAQLVQASKVLGAMNWTAFAQALETAFQRDGFTVTRCSGSSGGTHDFDLERQGRRMLVSARRWKSAHTGVEPLRALQAAREAADAPDALFIGLGDLSEPARKLMASERIAVWQGPELAQKLRGLLATA